MSRRESLYLDIVRALAALVVVLDHAQDLFDLRFLPRLGHQAVVVFFVLSGYVISHVAQTREGDARTFIIARLARLWSVLVPAVVLTVACDFVGQFYGPHADAYTSSLLNWPLVRIAASLGFVSESWVSIQLFSNGALWSLSCEFWYYMVFAVWTFAPRGRQRLVLLAIAALFAGHKGLLLLPVWLTGVALQRARAGARLNPRLGVACWLVGLAASAAILGFHTYASAWSIAAHYINPWLFTQLSQARVFWLDWVFGIAVAVHFAGARAIVANIPVERIERAVRWAAGISFSMYLFHEPLLHVCAAFLPRSSGVTAIGLTLGFIAVVGRPIENTKHAWAVGLEVLSRKLAQLRAIGRGPKPVPATVAAVAS